MTAPLSVRRSTCRICGSSALELVLPLTPTPSASHFARTADAPPDPVFPLDVLLCRRCGLVQLADTLDPEYLYAQSWERTSRDSPGMKEHFQQLAQDLRRFKPQLDKTGLEPDVLEAIDWLKSVGGSLAAMAVEIAAMMAVFCGLYERTAGKWPALNRARPRWLKVVRQVFRSFLVDFQMKRP